MSKVYPSKTQYEEALKLVKEYEDRQKTLVRLKEDLSFHLRKFNSVKFNVDKKQGRILFSGSLRENGQVVIGESICNESDVFNEVIGKLIAVKKALKLGVESVLEHVEVRKSIGDYINKYFNLSPNEKIINFKGEYLVSKDFMDYANELNKQIKELW